MLIAKNEVKLNERMEKDYGVELKKKGLRNGEIKTIWVKTNISIQFNIRMISSLRIDLHHTLCSHFFPISFVPSISITLLLALSFSYCFHRYAFSLFPFCRHIPFIFSIFSSFLLSFLPLPHLLSFSFRHFLSQSAFSCYIFLHLVL